MTQGPPPSSDNNDVDKDERTAKASPDANDNVSNDGIIVHHAIIMWCSTTKSTLLMATPPRSCPGHLVAISILETILLSVLRFWYLNINAKLSW